VALVVVMGVSGCGKSSIGRALARRLDVPFIEGDALHPAENVAKMAAGTPLDDNDRWPWLEKVGQALAETRQSGGAVAACSALKLSYRDKLREAAGADVIFVFMSGSRRLLTRRMKARKGHFMPASLLDSQLATLEPPSAPESFVAIDCGEPFAKAVARAEGFVSAAGQDG
jgi:gluconokinase